MHSGGFMSSARSVKTSAIARKIKHHQKAIAKHRDALRELIADAEEVAETCDEAIDHLEGAVNTLSQYL